MEENGYRVREDSVYIKKALRSIWKPMGRIG